MENPQIIIKKTGRPIGKENKKLKYIVELKNPLNDEWVIKNKYSSYKEIAEALNISLNTIREIGINRCKFYSKYIKIIKY